MNDPVKNSMASQHADASYEQLRTILERVQQYHQRFRTGLQHGGQSSESSSKDYLLRWLAATEKSEIELLELITAESDADILETWIQYVPDGECIERLESLKLRPEMSLDEVYESTMRFYQSLSMFYTQLAQQVSAETVKEFLQRLVDRYEAHLRTQAWMMRDLDTAS